MKPKLPKKKKKFYAQVFLDTAGIARKVGQYHRGEAAFSQGDAAASIMYLQKGGVKFSMVNGSDKEAVVAMFGPQNFFGEGCMAGQTVRIWLG
ncbi:MAG TPA: cyclic nucleotide-binding domain-containing protein [Candidatus Acidoferrum sp.]|jgi:CRP-like cAMP-binding protein